MNSDVRLAAALISAAFVVIPVSFPLAAASPCRLEAGAPVGRGDPQSASPPAEANFHLDRAFVGFKHKDYWEALRELRQIPLASSHRKVGRMSCASRGNCCWP